MGIQCILPLPFREARQASSSASLLLCCLLLGGCDECGFPLVSGSAKMGTSESFLLYPEKPITYSFLLRVFLVAHVTHNREERIIEKK